VEVDPDNPARLIVHTTQPADKGRANLAVLKLVAEHLGVAPSSLTIVTGATARTKIIQVDSS
jgi:hypothetical protein